MRRLLLGLLAALALASPAFAASYYFSDCGCDPTGTAKQQDACKRSDLAHAYCAGDFSDLGTFYCGQTCVGFPPTCLDACTGSTAVANFNCGGAIPSGGQLINPWCLAPEGNGTGSPLRNSFGAMSDGGIGSNLTTELASGDNVYLCAGYCDGSGTATYYVQPTENSVFITPRAAGADTSHRITIQPYPGESITISGDSNHNGTYDVGEVQSWMADKASGTTYTVPNWWDFEGGGTKDGNSHLKFCCISGGTAPAVFDVSNHTPGLANFIMNGIEAYGDTSAIWNGVDQGTLQAACGQGIYDLHFDNMGTGTVSITNSRFHDFCGMLMRHNMNTTPPANAHYIFDDNYVSNVGAVSVNNAFNIRGAYASTNTHEIARNTILDSGPISYHDNYQHVTIADNRIGFTGRVINLTGGSAIYASYGTTPNCTKTCTSGTQDCGGYGYDTCNAGTCTGPSDCSMDDITIARNIMYGIAKINFSSTTNPGAMISGISFDGIFNDSAATAFPTGVTIDNNIVEYQQERVTGKDCSTTDRPEAGIWWRSVTTGGVIRNNTIYEASNPLMVCSGPVTLTDNLIANGGKAVLLDAGATSSTIQYNDIYGPSTILNNNGTTYACAAAATIGTGDICSLPAFTACDSATYCPATSASQAYWDMHLAGNQVCIGAGASCSTLDVDGTRRPSPCDLGADQWFFPNRVVGPIYPPYPPPPPVTVAR